MTESKQLKILFVSRAHSQTAGGMERLSVELADAFATEPGIALQQITREKAGRVGAILWMLFKLPQIIAKSRQVDLVYLGDPVLALAGWLSTIFAQAKVAVTVHGLDVSYQSWFYQTYLQLFFRHFHYYFPISSAAKAKLAKLRVSGQIEKIVPGIKDQNFNPSLNRKQLEHVLGQAIESKVVLLTVGRLVERKGQSWFVREVLPYLPEQVLYVIAGHGPEAGAIDEAAQAAGVKKRVIRLGRVNDTELKILYNTIDAFIQPNVPVPYDLEGLGLALLEAALCQRPVFASDLEGITDAIHNGRNGQLLPPRQAQAWREKLSEFITHPYLSPAARLYTQRNFSWTKKVKQYLAALS